MSRRIRVFASASLRVGILIFSCVLFPVVLCLYGPAVVAGPSFFSML